MITPGTTARQPTSAPPHWQKLLQAGYRDAGELLSTLDLDPQAMGLSEQAQAQFPTRVPQGYVARMRYRDPEDPLLRQVLPVKAETRDHAGFVTDPVGDMASRQSTGVLKKYPGRALLITTGACAIHCRYCFRRHFPYGEENAARGRWEGALNAVAADPDIREVILSGGDPLSLSDQKLTPLIQGLGQIDHVKRLRIHTRLPVVLPERVDDDFIQLLSGFPGPVTVVLHANHGREIDDSVASAVHRLQGRGILLLNQAVLLRGVNDDVHSQQSLSEALSAIGVAPYYLHQLDPVAGAAHFQVSDREALSIMAALRRQAPGYMVPRLVREVPGEASKTPIESAGPLETDD
ncbi:EF-P beta-lysylation protein EpmB [Natronospira proteinivora]|uniref:L-lysine 2,3-aminomutase n=1 Tax=Natronospira proteinivora TaxID=1807133 RepID=A0ABT1G7U6_9GAMM|nr:EF-P beta-lysylation protein EpmB [Natronospira proteinivora]MCP1727122.1 EF-P beta-lysylation protein EpmB [Natronospira proteinivora]